MAKTSWLATLARYVLGIVLVVFGLNGFLQFMPMPELTGPAGAFMGALFASGYIFNVVNSLKIVIGLLLLFNKYVHLALILLAPLSINFVLFHLFLDPAGIAAAALVFIINIYLGVVHKEAYAHLFENY